MSGVSDPERTNVRDEEEKEIWRKEREGEYEVNTMIK
jgi:hypothetical protein